ncbi:hypothetical protein F3J17_30785 [Burkholderia sp. Ax-1719]|nr:hypothetical protein [Burkholderia sp. Ax-1719]
MFLALMPATMRRLSTHSKALSTFQAEQLGFFSNFYCAFPQIITSLSYSQQNIFESIYSSNALRFTQVFQFLP